MRGRDKFWKFYDHLESLRNGLKHEDYQHVVSILKQYVSAERTLFTRHCHKVLATEVDKSQAHMENTIKIAGNNRILEFNYSILYPEPPLNTIPTVEDWKYYTKKTYS